MSCRVTERYSSISPMLCDKAGPVAHLAPGGMRCKSSAWKRNCMGKGVLMDHLSLCQLRTETMMHPIT